MLVPVMRSGRISSSSSTCSTAIWASPLAPPEPSARPRVGRSEAPAWPQSSPRVRAAATDGRRGGGGGGGAVVGRWGPSGCRGERPRGAWANLPQPGPAGGGGGGGRTGWQGGGQG